MKLSILTATYNRADLLKRLYESIVNNLIEKIDIEWLIMDDGSTDNTKDIVSKMMSVKNLDVKYYKQENQGKMQAINNLMEHVTGDLVMDCDSDDYFIDNAFEFLNIILNQHNSVAFHCCQLHFLCEYTIYIQMESHVIGENNTVKSFFVSGKLLLVLPVAVEVVIV